MYSGNIGYFSLMSASVGNFAIDAFEPADRNILRFCESVVLNKWMTADETNSLGHKPSIDIHPLGLSDQEGVLVFHEFANMPGVGSFNTPMERGGKNYTERELPVMRLDSFVEAKGWFSSQPNIEILKIDVEGHGAHVLLGARRLMSSGLVKNVFNEVSLHEDKDMFQAEMEAIRLLVDTGYKLVGQGTESGPGEKSLWETDDSIADNIFSYLKTLKGKGKHVYMNLWWSKNHDDVL
jgi:FkbM family methyltransferase